MINDNKSDMIPFMSSFSATRKARLTYDRLWLSCSDRKWLQRETGTMNRRECMFFILSIFLKYINFAVLSFNEYQWISIQTIDISQKYWYYCIPHWFVNIFEMNETLAMFVEQITEIESSYVKKRMQQQ